MQTKFHGGPLALPLSWELERLGHTHTHTHGHTRTRTHTHGWTDRQTDRHKVLSSLFPYAANFSPFLLSLI